MKYLVKSDKERHPIDTFFKSIAATVKTGSPYQNICKPIIFEIVSEV
jgi:hypothetical protein